MKTLSSTVIKFIIGIVMAMLLLVIINVITLMTWMLKNSANMHTDESIRKVANELVKSQEKYGLGESGRKIVEEEFAWAMLISEDGDVVWSINLPEDVPKHYTLSKVASFSRWYLEGYPVSVWQHPDGLLVLGDVKDSYWKYNLIYGMDTLKGIPRYGIYFVIVNSLVAFSLALGLGLWLYQALKPIAGGIEKLSQKQVTNLSKKGMFGDLAEKVNITSQTIKMQEELLIKRERARINWIRGVSHDIRTPLSMIMGYAAEIEEDATNIMEVTEQAGIIKRQSIRIRDLVSDLNLASKLEYDMQPLGKKQVYPAEIIRSVVVEAINDATNRGNIYINISKEAQKASVLGDMALLKRALANLINNSIKHNGNKVNITVNAIICEDYYQICLQDDGKGVSEDELMALKNRTWESVDYETTDEVPHGMGLMIVRKIIEVHNGKWQIKSQENSGFGYTIQIPIKFE